MSDTIAEIPATADASRICGWCRKPRPCMCRTNRRKSGHLKTILPAGLPSRSGTEGGWRATCACGWSSEPTGTRTEAKAAYTGHRLAALPICGRCRQPKQPEEMAKRSPHLCKPCLTAKTKEWAAANPSRWEESRRKSHLKKKYGITVEEHDAIFAAQGGVCAICRRPPSDSRGYRMHIDHCHITGKVRGILCNTCNQGIGQFKDDLDLVEKAAEYLRSHKESA